jgi:hypothetical protein
MRLVIATPFYDMRGMSPYISSLVSSMVFLAKKGIDVDFWELSGDTLIDRARNVIANRFMKSDYTDLLFIDSDMKWDIPSLLNILKHDVDVVGAGYPCKNMWDYWGCVLNTEKGYENTYDESGVVTHVGPPVNGQDGLVSAQYVATGFMKIKREVFVKLAEKQPDNFYIDQKRDKYFGFFDRMVPLGEDYSFCQRWRDIGGELWVEPDCTISHYGVQEHTGNYKQFLLSMPEAKKVQNVAK